MTPADQLECGPSQAAESSEYEYLDEDFLSQLESAENAAEDAVPASASVRSPVEFLSSPVEKRSRLESESETSTSTLRGSSMPRSLEGSLEKTCSAFSQYMKSRAGSASSATVGDSDYSLCLSLYSQLKNLKNKKKKIYIRRQILELMSEMESDEE